MKTIRFSETVTRRRAGTEQVFEAGNKYTLPDDIADHYTKRGQAQVVDGGQARAEPVKAKSEAKQPDAAAKKTDSESANAKPDVERAATVDGADGGGTGGRRKPAAKRAARGTGGGRGKGKSTRGQ